MQIAHPEDDTTPSQLGANDQPLQAKTAEGPAPARVRRVEPDRNVARADRCQNEGGSPNSHH
jgi:hypothetical protein